MFLPHLYLITCPFGVMLLPLRIYVLSELGSVKWLEVLVRYNVPSDSGRQGQIRGYEIGGKGVNWKIGDRGSIVRIWHREWRIMISDWQVSNTLFFFFVYTFGLYMFLDRYKDWAASNSRTCQWYNNYISSTSEVLYISLIPPIWIDGNSICEMSWGSYKVSIACDSLISRFLNLIK